MYKDRNGGRVPEVRSATTPADADCETAVIRPLRVDSELHSVCRLARRLRGSNSRVANVAVARPGEVKISPENAGSRAPDRLPALISDASILLLVSVCVSHWSHEAPTGALTATWC